MAKKAWADRELDQSSVPSWKRETICSVVGALGLGEDERLRIALDYTHFGYITNRAYKLASEARARFYKPTELQLFSNRCD